MNAVHFLSMQAGTNFCGFEIFYLVDPYTCIKLRLSIHQQKESLNFQVHKGNFEKIIVNT